jgi:hypothetical protein
MIFEVVKNTIMITSFVLVIMLILEFINVQTHGKWLKKIENKRWTQYFITSFLGVIPGCVGTFGVVSMYIHNFISFGALVTALIATFGDEAFVMFALMPGKTLVLTAILLVIGIAVGILIDLLMKNKIKVRHENQHFEIHQSEEHCRLMNHSEILLNIRRISLPRATLLSGALLIILGILTGEFSEGHIHTISHGNWSWEQISFFVVMLVSVYIILRVSDHFLEKHLWEHLVKKHFLKIFLWTFGALLFIQIFNTYLHWDSWIKSNQLIILFLAVIIGIIPESGPHLIFFTLFMNGTIPFSTLLASSIVQDGHGALPLLAESKKSFFVAKAINILVGLIVGAVGLYLF